MMAAMLAHPDAAERDLSCLRLCTSAGEALPRELYERWRTTFGVEVLDGIGSSEAYHIYISNRPGRVRPGSTGELVPGYEARPRREPASSRSRATRPRSCTGTSTRSRSATFSGDTVRTGDLFERDEDGFFWYRGRARRPDQGRRDLGRAGRDRGLPARATRTWSSARSSAARRTG